MKTPGGTPVGDVMLSLSESELARLRQRVTHIESELNMKMEQEPSPRIGYKGRKDGATTFKLLHLDKKKKRGLAGHVTAESGGEEEENRISSSENWQYIKIL